MTTNLTTNFGLPIPPLDSVGTTDNYSGLMTAADTAIYNASGKGAWTDYSGTTIVTGWGSLSVTIVIYKKFGSLLFVRFGFVGTSNANSASFTLPYAAIGNTYGAVGYVVDNSIPEAAGYCGIANAASTVFLYRSAGALWTAANDKNIYGQFFYEVA